jgi:50S ribosome-binding GTPase
LLPDFIADSMSNDQLKDYFYNRTKEIAPAGIYLCSESPEHMKKFGGIRDLAADLWAHLDGRDPYIVGSANIGKSTLTDILISGFLNRGERLEQFRDRLAVMRVTKLREARVTKSSLPGTTLQNIRVPCFMDHEQALWDTPGM